MFWSIYIGFLAVVHALYQSPLITPQDHSQGYQFDELLHLPGTSPYFDAIGFGLEHKAPEGCKVTAASYLVRHAAIYANKHEFSDYIKPFLFNLEQHRGGFSGPLAFLNTFVTAIDEDHLEDITPSGSEDAEKVGRHLLNRYPDLVPGTRRILADKKARTYDTAKAFVKGWPHPSEVEVVRIVSNVNGSLDTITPHKSCEAFNKDPGTEEMHTFLSGYAAPVRRRLHSYLPSDFHLRDTDVIGMQSLCGYESAITGKRSKLCGVFTDVEWLAYEYAWDMKYFNMVGPANPLSPYLGFPWLQSQSELLTNIDDGTGTGDGWPKGQRFFLAFTHREVPPFIATALGIFNSSSENEQDQFPLDRINFARAWKMSDLIPFLGHVGMEKMECDRPGMEGSYIRFIANTAPRPLPNCQSGPGASCPFEQWKDIVAAGSVKYKDYESVCTVGVPA